MLKNIDVVKVVKIAGTAMTVVGTLMSGWAGNKETTQTIKHMVEEQLKNK